MEDFAVNEVSMEEDTNGNQVLGIVARPSKVYADADVTFRQNEQDSYPIVNKAVTIKSRLLPDEDPSLSQEELHGYQNDVLDQSPNFKYKTASVPPRTNKRIYESITSEHGDVELHDTAIEHHVLDIVKLHNINVQSNIKHEQTDLCYNNQGIIIDKNVLSNIRHKIWQHRKADQSGSFGDVLSEIDPITQQSLAIKRTKKTVLSNELRMTLQLRNAPNIQRLAGVACGSGFCYIVMQNAGMNLKRFGSLQDYQAILHTKPQLCGLLHDLLSAFRSLHEIGVHCDGKPENICVKWSPNLDRFIATVIDFGSSMFHSDELPEIQGITYEYLPPDYMRELFTNHKGRRITPLDDIYAVALVMLFLREGNHATIKFILNRCNPPMEHYPQGDNMMEVRTSVIREIAKFQGEQLPPWFLKYPHCKELEPLLQKMLWLTEDGRCDAREALAHLNLIMGCNPPQHKKKQKVMHRSPSTFDDTYEPPSPGLSLANDMSQLKMKDGSSKQTQSTNLRESMTMNLSYSGKQMDYQDMDVRRKKETVVSKSTSNQKSAARPSKVMPPEDEDFKGEVMNDEDKAMLLDLFNDVPKFAVIQKEAPKTAHTTMTSLPPTRSPVQGAVTYVVKPRQMNQQGQLMNQQGQLMNQQDQLMNQQGQLMNHQSQLMNQQGHVMNQQGHLSNPRQQVISMTYRGGRVVQAQGAGLFVPGVLHCQGEADQSSLEPPAVSGSFGGPSVERSSPGNQALDVSLGIPAANDARYVLPPPQPQGTHQRPKLTGKRMSGKRMAAPFKSIQVQPQATLNPNGMDHEETFQQDIPGGNVPNFEAMFE